MSRKNFYISTDSDGNMPVMTSNSPAKKHYVQYRNDVPIGGCLYENQDRVWNYAEEKMYGLLAGVVSYGGGPDLPVIDHFNLWNEEKG